MGYEVRYWYEFRDMTERLHRVEILEYTIDQQQYPIVAEELTALENPFSVEWPDFDKFEPVRGSGCELNLLSSFNYQLTDLYTMATMTHKIKHLINGVLHFVGWLDSENYREPFDEVNNYEVKVTGNDGLNVLDRLKFSYMVGGEAVNYTGLKSDRELLTIILSKLNLEHHNCFVGLSTHFANYPSNINEQNRTILNASYVDCANFYDEEGVPMSCREVLEEVLRKYGAFIIIHNANVYICDTNTFAKAQTTWFKYNNTLSSYVGTVVSNNTKNINTLGYFENGQAIEFEKLINTQSVTASPYAVTTVFDLDISEGDYNDTVENTWFVIDHLEATEDKYDWHERAYINGIHPAVTRYEGADIVRAEDYQYRPIDKEPYVLVYNNNNMTYKDIVNENVVLTHNAVSNIFLNTINFLRISGEGYIRTKLQNNNYNEAGKKVLLAAIFAEIKCGDWWYEGGYKWQKTKCYCPLFIGTDKDTDKTVLETTSADEWQKLRTSRFDNDAGILIPLKLDPGESFAKDSYLTIKLINFIRTYTAYPGNAATTWTEYSNLDYKNIKDIRLRKLKVEVVYADGEEISTKDVEYKGEVNPLVKDDNNIDVKICSHTSNDAGIQKGAIIKKTVTLTPEYKEVYDYADGATFDGKAWTREGVTDRIERLLIRSVLSNYHTPSMVFNGNINTGLSMIDNYTLNEMPGRVFGIHGARYHARDNNTEIKLVEIRSDTLTLP